jgi:hypothetical protein
MCSLSEHTQNWFAYDYWTLHGLLTTSGYSVITSKCHQTQLSHVCDIVGF